MVVLWLKAGEIKAQFSSVLQTFVWPLRSPFIFMSLSPLALKGAKNNTSLFQPFLCIFYLNFCISGTASLQYEWAQNLAHWGSGEPL